MAAQKKVDEAKALESSMTAISQVDADFDGLSNADETKTYHTDPNKADTDGDGLLDGDEIKIYHTDPLKWSTAGDKYSDGWKVRRRLNPLLPYQPSK